MLLVVLEPIRDAAVGDGVKQALPQQPHPPVLGLAQAICRFDDLVQHGLQPLGAGDRPQNIAQGALLRAQVVELAREPAFGLRTCG
jgi:hypothetical protein